MNERELQPSQPPTSETGLDLEGSSEDFFRSLHDAGRAICQVESFLHFGQQVAINLSGMREPVNFASGTIDAMVEGEVSSYAIATHMNRNRRDLTGFGVHYLRARDKALGGMLSQETQALFALPHEFRT